ncbi:hypothetical protein KN815_08735 [Streptomyces sp. 4503]|uniref:Uncharacterized protein n=1 Tax=Streptomyces niphimycinicus TaxID=2842201 RepID=A0ABS6CB76_9ACTN|nr:hypothetical protein [Streptomyces niphimycinicus]MBU3864159.1 hypothetical protein [Streptomyces niphimycinicus]
MVQPLGVDRRHEDAENTRRRLHRDPFAKIYKNDTSAFKKRTKTQKSGRPRVTCATLMEPLALVGSHGGVERA